MVIPVCDFAIGHSDGSERHGIVVGEIGHPCESREWSERDLAMERSYLVRQGQERPVALT